MNQTYQAQAKGVRLFGTGMSVPRRVLTNDDLAKMVDTSDQWITKRTGIRSRHLGGESTTVRELAVDSLTRALSDSQLDPGELDLVILATLTPEMCCPATAARVVAEVGASPAGAMDLSAACSGFVYGLNLAASLVNTGHYRHVGVIGAEMLSQIVDWQDRGSCVLFGDGAGAAIVGASDNPIQRCLYQSMGSDGNAWHVLYCPRNESDLPKDHDGFTGAYNTLQMNGREVYKFAVSTLQQTITDALNATGMQVDDLDMVIPHQSNQRILDSAREKLGIPPEKVYSNIDRFGNTSAASVPICLNELKQAGRLHEGDLVLMVALGGGLTWASSLWRF